MIQSDDKHSTFSESLPGRMPTRNPFLSWAGGKRKLLSQILPHLPKKFNRYYEPFLGSGSMFFSLMPRNAILNDMNKALADTFKAVRNDPEKIIAQIEKWEYSREEYYRIRDNYLPRTAPSKAAQFIYLNKTCWNALYRVNLKGKFNVPFGQRKTKVFFYPSEIRTCSSLLKNAKIICCDFQDCAIEAKEDDFVFFDPPYVTGHNNNGFIEYNANLFTWSDQIRLAKLAKQLVSKKVGVAITNAAHDAIKKLYPGFKIIQLTRHSTIAGNSNARKPTEEVLILGGY